MTELRAAPLANAGRLLGAALVRGVHSAGTVHPERMPRTGPVIIVSNHRLPGRASDLLSVAPHRALPGQAHLLHLDMGSGAAAHRADPDPDLTGRERVRRATAQLRERLATHVLEAVGETGMTLPVEEPSAA